MEEGSLMSLTNYVPTFIRGCDILLIHDEPMLLLRLSTMLEQYSFKVTSTKDTSEAESMIKNDHKGKFKLIMVKANMLGMDTILFPELINKDIPVILIYSEKIDDETRKAIKTNSCYLFDEPITCSNDLKNVWQQVFNYSCQEIQNVGESHKVNMREMKKKRLRVDDDESNNMVIKEKKIDGRSRKRVWTPERHQKFEEAVFQLGENARPKLIYSLMNEPNLTVCQVSSHLQRYRAGLCEQNVRNFDLPPADLEDFQLSTELFDDIEKMLDEVDVIHQKLDGVDEIQQKRDKVDGLRQIINWIEHMLDEVEHELDYDLDKFSEMFKAFEGLL